jgi:molybdate/tungstate transport system substrate-binding protein
VLTSAVLLLSPSVNSAEGSPIDQNQAGNDAVASDTSIKVLHAGSITDLVQNGLAPALKAEKGITVLNERGNSVFLANSIKDNSKVGDIFMSADAAVNYTLMNNSNGNWVKWFVIFGRNSVVLAYSPKSKYVNDFEKAKQGEIPWCEVLLKPDIKFVRDNPDLDPLGYYGLFVSALAQDYYKIPNLKERILGNDTNPQQVVNTSVSMLANGEVDAMFMYQTGAAAANVPYIILPDEINLSNPNYASNYAKASYTTNKGQTFYGAPINFSATILEGIKNQEAAISFIEYLLSPKGQEIIKNHNFIPSPILVGGDRTAVPSQIKPYIQGEYK